MSWSIVTYPNLDVYELLLSASIGSLIDLDHFISAKSLRLIDAISLNERPFLHNSLNLFCINVLLFFVLYFGGSTDKYMSWSLLVYLAWFSHHIRDANRRGLWLGSVYTTQPVRTSVYVLVILIQPLIIRYIVFGKRSDLRSLARFKSGIMVNSSSIWSSRFNI